MPTSEMTRFTAWMTEREREALDKVAEEQNTSVNFIVRSALRQYPPIKRKLADGVPKSA